MCKIERHWKWCESLTGAGKNCPPKTTLERKINRQQGLKHFSDWKNLAAFSGKKQPQWISQPARYKVLWESKFGRRDIMVNLCDHKIPQQILCHWSLSTFNKVDQNLFKLPKRIFWIEMQTNYQFCHLIKRRSLLVIAQKI